MGLAIVALSVVAAIWPHVVAWPAAALGAWLGVAWLWKAFALRRPPAPSTHATSGDSRSGEEEVSARD